MKLKTKKNTFICCEYRDLEEFILFHSKTLGILIPDDYEITCSEELQNDSLKIYNVEKQEIDEYDKNRLATGNLKFQFPVILTILANLNLIKEGEYLLNVSW